MKIVLTFVDDQIPVKPGEDNKIIASQKLTELLKMSIDDWYSQIYLKALIEKVTSTQRYIDGEIIINAFKHPEFLLAEIDEKGFSPNVIIYDWEYETQSHESAQNLLEILKKTKAFIFVYSSFFDAIPPSINKSDFNEFSNRIQLLSKGDKQSSVFSSEEFIIQYVLGLFSKNNIIQLSNHKVKFTSSGYLEDASDITYLESVLGRDFILSNLEKIQYEISEEKLESLFGLVNETFYITKDKKYVISEDNELMNKNYGPLEKISYKEVLRLIGVKGIDKLLNGGIHPI